MQKEVFTSKKVLFGHVVEGTNLQNIQNYFLMLYNYGNM